MIEKTSNEHAIKRISEIKNCKNRKVYSGDNKLLVDKFTNACDVTDPLEEVLQDLFVEHFAELGLASFNFLSEPLYRIAYYYVSGRTVILIQR